MANDLDRQRGLADTLLESYDGRRISKANVVFCSPSPGKIG